MKFYLTDAPEKTDTGGVHSLARICGRRLVAVDDRVAEYYERLLSGDSSIHIKEEISAKRACSIMSRIKN